MGGSLLPLGGQNLIDRRPRQAGIDRPAYLQFRTGHAGAWQQAAPRACRRSRPDGAAVTLLNDTEVRSAMGAKALAFANQHRGATARTLAALVPLISRT